MTPSQRPDSVCARLLLEGIRVPRTGLGRPRCKPDQVIADKAYSSCGFRAYLRKHGIACTIPEKADQQRHRHNRGPSRWPAPGVRPALTQDRGLSTVFAGWVCSRPSRG
ncbi:hypothetical protein [Streptomyces sp. SID1328]|uniref:hypothetical protein n=1 Tax=Streptomyces sp. SID1328 TaxID=2690250 RepID=UPI001F44B6DC|nr:hypothetical protein [Streptomyces sp. SID1328]